MKQGKVRTLGTIVVAASLLATAGCSGTAGSKTSPTSAAPPKPVSLAEAKKIAAEYTKNNNAAIKAALNGKYDAKAWETADTGPALAEDKADSRRAKIQRTKAGSWTVTADSVFNVPSKGYPHSIVLGQSSKDSVTLRHYVRDEPNANYLYSQDATMPKSLVGKALPTSKSVLTAGDWKRVDAQLAKVSRYLNGQMVPMKFGFDPRQTISTFKVKEANANPTISAKAEPFDKTDPKMVLAMKTSTGVIVMASTRGSLTQKATKGRMTLYYPEARQYYGVPGPTKSFSSPLMFGVTVFIPTKGEPILLERSIVDVL